MPDSRFGVLGVKDFDFSPHKHIAALCDQTIQFIISSVFLQKVFTCATDQQQTFGWLLTILTNFLSAAGDSLCFLIVAVTQMYGSPPKNRVLTWIPIPACKGLPCMQKVGKRSIGASDKNWKQQQTHCERSVCKTVDKFFWASQPLQNDSFHCRNLSHSV